MLEIVKNYQKNGFEDDIEYTIIFKIFLLLLKISIQSKIIFYAHYCAYFGKHCQKQ